MDRSRLAINQITTPSWSLKDAIDNYAKLDIAGIGIWRDKLTELGTAKTRQMLDATGLFVPSLCKTGDIAKLDIIGKNAALDDCRKAIDEAAEIGAPVVVFVGGGCGTRSLTDARKRVGEVLSQASEHARTVGVDIGLEPFHPMHAAERGCINTLSQACELRQEIGNEVAVILDVFHCWWDPALTSHLEKATQLGVASAHLCDWRVPTRDPVMDRAMPGDGAADISGFIRQLEVSGYNGPYEFEIFSADWAARDPIEVVHICLERYDRYCQEV